MAEINIIHTDGYEMVRDGTVLKAMVQFEAGQDGRHYVRFFSPDLGDAYVDSYDAALTAVNMHVYGPDCDMTDGIND